MVRRWAFPAPRWYSVPHRAAFVLALLTVGNGTCGLKASDEERDFFESKIRPVLVQHCYECHSAKSEKVQGKLLLDNGQASRKGGESGPAVIPGDPDGSLLIQAIRYESYEMPPQGKLPDAVIADFERWIKRGAFDPRVPVASEATSVAGGTAGQTDAGGNNAAAIEPGAIDFAAARQFWSFQSPKSHAPPAVRRPGWPRTRIDPFLLARLEQAGLAPTNPAAPAVWLRRLTFDLTGLPPTPEEIAAYLADRSPGADERVVERLLASPHFGERTARLWLDLARYAEDQAHIVGKDESLFYPNAYLYRDWVIRAINEDMPYDRFVRLQLAADLCDTELPDIESYGHGGTPNTAALGFIGLGPKYYSRRSLQVMSDEWEDRVDLVGRGLLGLTVACARCHDHKFDPIAAEDYYALAGVFASTSMFNRPLQPDAEKADEKQKDNKEFENGKKSAGEAKDPKQAMHIVCEGTPTDLNIFIRGNVENKGPLAVRHFPRILCRDEPVRFTSGSGRRELAESIVAPDNPLTARVFVNRIWGLYFGRPLVTSASNFGRSGEPPTHPELLDDLAVRFVAADWSLKWLVREIVLSAAYRQASHVNPSSLAADPENRLLGRMSRRRLSVEQWRDTVLAVTGRLDESVGGRSIDPQDPQQRRRTVYSRASRLELNRLLAMFDYPDPNVHADRRVETTTPLQKMFVMNSPLMVGQAAALADRLREEVTAGGIPTGDVVDSDDWVAVDRQRIERAYLLLYARPATELEIRIGLDFLAGGDAAKVDAISDQERSDRLQQYAHVLLAANELLYVD